MEKLTNFIYKKIVAVNPLFRLLPIEDVKQEIRIAIFLEDSKENIRASARNISRLATELGYSRKKGKDNFLPFYTQDTDYDFEKKELIEYIEELYKKHTVREICKILQIEYTSNLQKKFHRAFPKKASHGGKRKNAGRKKSVKK